MAEMLQTFFALNETKSLTAKKELGEKVAYLSDTVEFQTLNSVTVDPLGVVDPVLHSLRIERVSASAVASRDDIHKVIISIALPPDAPQIPVPKPSGKTVRPNKDPRSSNKRTLGEEKALDQIENQILRDRTVISPTTLRELQNLQ